MNVFDFLFPTYCISCKAYGSYICPTCFAKLSFSTKFLCLVCTRPSINGLTHPMCISAFSPNGVFSSLEYTGLTKKLVYQFKYKPFLSDLQTPLGELLYEGIIQHEALMKELENANVLCTAIPLSPQKKRKRGYNQAELLAKVLAKHMGIPYKEVLIRVKDTKSQFTLSKRERRENMTRAFAMNNQCSIINDHVILLVDDILTTGSTLLEASKILKKAGAYKVFGVTLAKD